MRRWIGAAAVLAASYLATSCNKTPARSDPLVAHARFGIFFGGQVQERSELPFELDQTKQTQGFRLDFKGPLQHSHTVAWEIDMPGTSQSVRDEKGRVGKGRLSHVGQEQVQKGQRRLDHPIPFKPGDPLGVWNVRVTVDKRIVIDRMFRVYNAERRKRRRAQKDGGS